MPKESGGLGFRDIKYFNQLLLTKHVWSLTQNSNSLVARVLKICYYPNGDILRSQLDYGPTYLEKYALGNATIKERVSLACGMWEEY